MNFEMEVKIDKSFQKDIKKIKSNDFLLKVAESINISQNANNIKQIKGLKKLRGSSNHYRIKIGDFRLGLIISESTIIFTRCLHRKDIYKYFPK